MATSYTIEEAGASITLCGSAIAVNSAGRIYAVYMTATAAPYNQTIKIKYSDDVGKTWNAFLSLASIEAPYDASFGEARLVVDSNDHLHLIYGYRTGATSADVKLYHRSWISGTGWSSAHEVTDLIAGETYPGVVLVDDTDVIHIVTVGYSGSFKLYHTYSSDDGVTWSDLVTIATSSGGTVRVAGTVDTDGNLHVAWTKYGNYGGGSATNENVEYCYYNGSSWTCEWATSYNTASPYDQVPYGILYDDDSSEVFILYMHQALGSNTTRCAVKSAGNWSQEGVVSEKIVGGSLVKDGDGTIYALIRYIVSGSDYYYEWTKRLGTDSWDTKDDIYAVVGTVYTYLQGMFNNFPVIGGVRSNVPLSGCYGMYVIAGTSIQWWDNGTVPMTVYPSDTLARVTGLIHRYQPGHYSLEIFLGDVKAEWDIADYLYGAKAGVPGEDGIVEPDPDLEYYRWRNLAYQDEPPLRYPGQPRTGREFYPEATPPPEFPVIQPEWAQGDSPTELSGLFRTAEELKYGVGGKLVDDFLQKAKAEELADKAFQGAKGTATASTQMPQCPAGQAPRNINGVWKCVPITGKFGGY